MKAPYMPCMRLEKVAQLSAAFAALVVTLVSGIPSTSAGQTFKPQPAIDTEVCEKFMGFNNCETIRTDRVHRTFTQTQLGKSLFGESQATASHCTNFTSDQKQCAQSVFVTTDPIWNRLVWGHHHTFIKAYGTGGRGQGQFLSPQGVAMTRRSGDGHTAFIADAGNNRVVILVVNHISRAVYWRGVIDGSESGMMLSRPNDVAYDHVGTWSFADDRLFILDSGNDRVLVYRVTADPNSSSWSKVYLGQFGSRGSDYQQLHRPSGIAVSSRSGGTNVIIADEGNHRIALWYYDYARFPAPLDASHSATYPDAQFSSVAFDNDENVIAADRNNNRLHKFGVYRGLFEVSRYGSASQPWASGNFNAPTDVEVVRSHKQDVNGNLVTTALPYLHTTEAWTATTGMQLHRLGVSPDSLSLSVPTQHGREADLTFLFTGNGSYYARVLSGKSVVRSFPSTAAVAGWRNIHWDGLNDQGQSVGAGTYTFQLTYKGGYSDDIDQVASVSFNFTNPPYEYPPLTVQLSGPSTIPPWTSVTWYATVSGGTGTYSHGWTLTQSDGSTVSGEGNLDYFTGQVTKCGTFTVSLSVWSNDGQTQTATITGDVGEQTDPNKPSCIADPTGFGLAEQAIDPAPSQFEMSQNSLESAPTFQLSGAGLQRTSGSMVPSSTARQQLRDRARTFGITSLKFGVPRATPVLAKTRGTGTPRFSRAATATTTTAFSSKPTTIRIYNMNGALIRTAVNQVLEPGYYQYDWDGRTDSGQLTAPGVFVAVMSAPGFTKSVKLVRVR
jgi:hypothetical protein